MSEIRSIVVAGAGPVAWIAACSLLRAFRQRPLVISVVDTGASCERRIGRWTLPSQRGMHALLGIVEPHFVHHTGATYKLASEHLGWQGEGSGYLHAHGSIGPEINSIPFYKFVLSQIMAGKAPRPEAWSLAAAAVRLGKFARPMGEGNALTASFTYGFHLEEAAYVRYLRAHALRLGVREAQAAFAGVTLDGQGSIQSLQLADGTNLTADYFIDCTGPEAHLLNAVAACEREDWSAWLPCDRMWSGLAPASSNPPPVLRTQATTAGWAWRAPLAQASMVGLVYCSRFQDDATARAALRATEPGLADECVLTRFSSGRRRRFWERNCVALGAAAVELEPLVGADLHLAQLGLANFIELFPLTRASRIEADEYNRIMAEHADALRDFTLAHYRAGAPRPGEFWAATRAAPAPAQLTEKLDLYAASGRINLLDHETFEEMDWAWVMLGCGSKPDSLELQVRQRLTKFTVQETEALRAHVQQLAASMPRHMDFVRHQASQAAHAAG